MKTMKLSEKLLCALILAMCSVQIFAVNPLSLSIQAANDASRGNWEAAESKLVQVVNAYDEERHESLYGSQPMYGVKMDFYAPINHVQACVELAIVRCNIHDRRGAVQAMEKAVYLIKNSPTLKANDSHELAEKFLSKLRSSSADFTFTTEEEARLVMMLTAAPRANADRCHSQYMNRMNAIIGYCNARTQYYQQEMDRTARQAVRTADFEYHQNTGRDFDSREKPPVGTKARIEWDYCNKIHQIFK